MVVFDADERFIVEHYKPYLKIFEEYAAILYQRHYAHLHVRMLDYSSSNLLTYRAVSISNRVTNTNENPRVVELLSQLKQQIEHTCSKCGALYAKQRSNSYPLDNVSILCERCFLCVDDVAIRYISPLIEFDYAVKGSYFFYENQCYVGTNNLKYKKFCVSNDLIHKGIKHNITGFNWIIKTTFAGQDTGFKDESGVIVYTGDVILCEGKQSPEVDLFDASNKSRNPYIKANDICYTVCGAVATNPSHYKHYKHNLFEAVLDNHGAFLVTARTIEVIGNVFYDVPKDEPIDIWTLAGRFAFSGYQENGFWSNNTTETAKEAFLEIPTPTFLEPSDSYNRKCLRGKLTRISSAILTFSRSFFLMIHHGLRNLRHR